MGDFCPYAAGQGTTAEPADVTPGTLSPFCLLPAVLREHPPEASEALPPSCYPACLSPFLLVLFLPSKPSPPPTFI